MSFSLDCPDRGAAAAATELSVVETGLRGLSLIFCATGFDVVQLSFQSTEVISGVERLQFVFEVLPQTLAH